MRTDRRAAADGLHGFTPAGARATPPDMIRLRDPGLAQACFLALAPAVAVLQFRAVAPLALAALTAMALAGPRRAALPAPAWFALALMLWGAASSLWAVEPSRSLFEGLRMAGLVLLAGVAGQARPTGSPLPWLAGGLLAGGLLALGDQLSGQSIRAAVRGLQQWDVTLGFGLKPAATVLALWLPLALAKPATLALAKPATLALAKPATSQMTGPETPPLPLCWGWRAAALLAGLAGIFCMPAQAAKIGVVAGFAAYGLVWLAGPRGARGLAVAAALLLLLTPPLLGAALSRGPDISALQPSASHRVLIWDFTLARIAERPWLGWGMESARAIPGGRDLIPAADLARFGLSGQSAWFAGVRAQRLPLHTHNAALQIWLELGAVGAVLAAVLVLVLGWRATSPGAAGAFAAAVTVGSLSYGIWQGWWLCLLAMLALTARSLSRAPPPR